MRKIISAFLSVLVLCTCTLPALSASSYSDLVDAIDDIVVDMYDSAESSPQQTSAAAFGSMYMLQIILNEISYNKTRTDAVSELVSSLTDDISKVEGAPQASALSLYGSVLVLAAIAYEKDRSGSYNDLISSTVDDLVNADTGSAVQEMANGSYRMVDMLSIIAMEEGVSYSVVSSILDLLSENDKKVDGAPQQTANGLYRSAELLYYIAKESCSSSAARSVSNLLDGMYEDNKSCNSAVQQTSNGMATVYLMLRTIAKDKA